MTEVHLTQQIVVRLTDEMLRELKEAAAANERTVAQEVRYRIRIRNKRAPWLADYDGPESS